MLESRRKAFFSLEFGITRVCSKTSWVTRKKTNIVFVFLNSESHKIMSLKKNVNCLIIHCFLAFFAFQR